jgi:hypothetical protein
MPKKKYKFWELVDGEKKEVSKQKFANDPHKEEKEFYQNRKEQYRVKNLNHGGEAVVQGAGAAIKGTGFKGVF